MNSTKHKKTKRVLRHRRVRSHLSGTAERPRLAVFRSDKHIYAQIIDDTTGTTVAAASDIKVDGGQKTERAAKVGASIAELAKKAGIEAVNFDRGGFKYHGRVKALAEAAREAGLNF
jgi:large subunit ribosomal protein L18